MEILHFSNHNGNFVTLHQGNYLSFTFWKNQTHFYWKDERNVWVSLLWKRNEHYIDTLSHAPARLESLGSLFLVPPSIPWALTSEPLSHSICFPIDFHYLCELVILWKKLPFIEQKGNFTGQTRISHLDTSKWSNQRNPNTGQASSKHLFRLLGKLNQ